MRKIIAITDRMDVVESWLKNKETIKAIYHLNEVHGQIQGGILFDDGTMLVDTHYQDCCENVYAHWEYLADEIGIYDTDFSNLKIEEIDKRKNRCGIRVCDKRKFYVPCYNEQNGYYDDRLNICFIDINNKIVLGSWNNVPVIDDID